MFFTWASGHCTFQNSKNKHLTPLYAAVQGQHIAHHGPYCIVSAATAATAYLFATPHLTQVAQSNRGCPDLPWNLAQEVKCKNITCNLVPLNCESLTVPAPLLSSGLFSLGREARNVASTQGILNTTVVGGRIGPVASFPCKTKLLSVSFSSSAPHSLLAPETSTQPLKALMELHNQAVTRASGPHGQPLAYHLDLILAEIEFFKPTILLQALCQSFCSCEAMPHGDNIHATKKYYFNLTSTRRTMMQ